MKNITIFLFIYLFSAVVFGQNIDKNRALHLDGIDNDIRIGMGIITSAWTLEAWIKGNDTSWKKTEVIFGGGQYSNLNITDHLPLEIKNGKLHNERAGLWSKNVLDDKWHHVALSCDGFTTCLYLDGKMVDGKRAAFSVLPGALGINEGDTAMFGGLIDEVRIWHSVIPAQVLGEWMYKPLSPSHPQFKSLIGYYNFDDELTDVVINWAGKGGRAYHLRSGRYNFRGSAPLACTVINDNPKFIKPIKRQELFNAVTINNEWSADQGTADNEVLKLRIAVTGTINPLSLSKLTLDLSRVSAISDISSIHIYYTGKVARSNIRVELFGKGRSPKRKMVFSTPKKAIYLSPGINYFLVTADIADHAVEGHTIKMAIPSFKLSNRTYTPEADSSAFGQKITCSSKTNPNIVKVLQWNIWHGGVHLGNDGVSRVIGLIKASHADVITMQEAYGSQQRIANSLGYFMHTASAKDNLALYSRFPIAIMPTSLTFNSNPTKITLSNGRQVLINGCWLRYGEDPEYTSLYPDTGLDPKKWVAEDSVLAMVDMQNIIEKDTKPCLINNDLPVIIGGDFNSCSHLDWTQAAAPLHFGYGPVAFPTSRYLVNEGYIDSFREMNPNEVLHPEGTWAVIYGQSQVCRIDFLYYKGPNIKALDSRIVNTSPDIDDVWASDHAAVLTTFKLTSHF